MTTTFSFEEAQGASTGGNDTFVPADRTSKKKVTQGVFNPADSDVVGELPEDQGIFNAIKTAAEEAGVPIEYGLALADQESRYKLDAHNDEFGADGLFQFIEGTAKQHGLQYGVDTRDPVKASKAAMKDFAAAMKRGGVEEAIMAHFAGPGGGNRGKKTQQYLADVTKRANDIREKLAKVGDTTNPNTPIATTSKTFSFEDALGPSPKDHKPIKTQEAGFADQAQSFLENSAKAIGRAAENGFDFVAQRLKDGPDEYLGQKLITIERSPAEIDALIEKEKNAPWYSGPAIFDKDNPEYWKNRREKLRFAKIPEGDQTTEIQARKTAAAEAPEEPLRGFVANLKNPVDLILNESLPANALKALTNAPAHARENFWKAREVAQQENIVANPDKFPAVAVEAAQNAISAREAKQDPTVREQWNGLRDAFKNDPGAVGAQFVNALMADPEMILAPIGVGVKPIQAVRGAEAMSRVTKIVDKVMDAGSTSAALNLGMEAASAAANNQELSRSDLTFSAASGFILGGFLGIIYPGNAGKAASRLDAAVKEGNLNFDDIIAKAAAEDVRAEEIINNPLDLATKHRIEDATGVKFESEADLKTYLQTARKEWRKLFAERDLNGQFQKSIADERAARRATLAEEATQRQASAEAAAQARATQTARFQSEYDQALQARDAAEGAGLHEQALKENELRSKTSQLDEQEIIDAAYSSTPEVRNAMLRAAHRDANLRVPKWQRGEIDPKVLARLGVGSLFAGTAFALAPPEDKVQAAFAAGLAGLVIPGGGRVLDRMRQSGVVSLDGTLPGMAELVAQGKLKPDVDLTTIRAQEAATLSAAKQGDQAAFKKLYEDNAPRLTRYLNKFLGSAKSQLGIDADDLAQEVFADVFRKIGDFKGDSGFYTYLQTVARNEALEAIRSINAEIRGGGKSHTSMYAGGSEGGESLSAGHIMEGDRSLIKNEVEDAAADFESPEFSARYQEAQDRMLRAIQKLPESQQTVFLLNRVESMTAQEIADKFKMPLGTVVSNLKRASDAVETAIMKDFDATRVKAQPETTAIPVEGGGTPIKRGRGRPRKNQEGSVDPELMKLITGVGGTAALAAYLVDNDDGKRSKTIAALGGAALGLLLFSSKGKGLKQAADMIDRGVGISSTRLLNNSPKIFRRAQNTERNILTHTHDHIANVDPFLVRVNKLGKEGQGILTRALLTGNSKVISRVLEAINDPELTTTYKNVRSTLDSIGDQLLTLNRFKKGNVEYFPRVVKDREGLFEAIGKEQSKDLKGFLKEANENSIRKNGRPLTDIEESAIINQVLFVDKRANQPAWAKNRGIDEITPELLPFYATPAESLHTYIRSAVQDIEKAKFFGRYAKNMPKGQFEFLDVDRSVNNLMAEEIKAGNLTDAQAGEISEVLKARFGKGEHSENDFIRNVKNIGNIGLLGNLWSAASQAADVPLQVYTQSLTSTLQSVVRNLTGKKIIDIKDFGLVDHISEEFANQLKTTQYLNKFFKYSLFAGMDKFGKNTALNAAVIKAKGLASTDSGVLKLANKYQDMFGDDFTKLVSELKSGKVTDLTKEYAWLELSRTQPISRLEMPTAYLNNPNLRTFWWLKSFTLKQFDLLRRDAYNEIKKGTPAGISKGMKNLVTAGIAMGMGGAGTQIVKDWMLGRDTKISWEQIPLNMFRNLGFSQYTLDKVRGVSKEEAASRRAAGEENVRSQKATPLEAIADMVAPPYKIFQDVLTGNPKAARYLVPIAGPYVAERIKKAEEEQKRIEREGDE